MNKINSNVTSEIETVRDYIPGFDSPGTVPWIPPKVDQNLKRVVVVPFPFLLRGRRLSGSAWRVLCCILSYDWKHIKSERSRGKITLSRKEKVWCSQKTISKDLDMPLRTVRSAISMLKKEGFIETKRRFNNSNEMHIKYSA